jgi:hypothetical protein
MPDRRAVLPGVAKYLQQLHKAREAYHLQVQDTEIAGRLLEDDDLRESEDPTHH